MRKLSNLSLRGSNVSMTRQSSNSNNLKLKMIRSLRWPQLSVVRRKCPKSEGCVWKRSKPMTL